MYFMVLINSCYIEVFVEDWGNILGNYYYYYRFNGLLYFIKWFKIKRGINVVVRFLGVLFG